MPTEPSTPTKVGEYTAGEGFTTPTAKKSAMEASKPSSFRTPEPISQLPEVLILGLRVRVRVRASWLAQLLEVIILASGWTCIQSSTYSFMT